MKRYLAIIVALTMIAVCPWAQAATEYTASAQGFGGMVTAHVTIENGVVTAVSFEADGETAEVGGQALTPLAERIVAQGNANVDVITGATVTSTAALAAVTACLNTANGTVESLMTPGTYEASAKGIDDNLRLAVTVDENSILSIEILENNETPFCSAPVFEKMVPAIIEHQTVGVDAMTGATATSSAVRTAVLDAIRQAGGNVASFSTPVVKESSSETIEKTVDVVIAGSGCAGMAAAVAASEKGASVLVLEKLAYVGGSAILSGGNMHGVDGPFEENTELENDTETLTQYWMDYAGGDADETMVRFMAENIADVTQWLIDHGVVYNAPSKTMGKYELPICLHATNAGGLITPLYEKALAGGVEFMTETPAVELLVEDGKVTGIIANNADGKVIVHANSVILATGGYNANDEMKAQYEPLLPDCTMQAGCPGNTGDGILMGQAVGAATVFKPNSTGVNLQSVPGVSFNSPVKNLAYVNALGITQEGVRYADETANYSLHQRAMVETGSNMFYKIIDASTGAGLESWLESAVQWGKAYKADTLEELAASVGIDQQVFMNTVTRYNSLCAKGVDEDFNKPAESMIAVETAPYYAVMCVPACSGSVGGLKIDLSARVLDESGAPIENLYAAGEVCNGDFFGDDYPISGSIDFGMTFGRIAGENASER